MTVGELKAILQDFPDGMMVEVSDAESCLWVEADGMIRVVAEIDCNSSRRRK